MSDEIPREQNFGVAFALVVAAGAATAIGAAVVFFPRLVKLANRRFLGFSLGLAAGVMTYVSLVDIYGKAMSGFMDSGHTEEKAFIYTTLCFFAGIVLMVAINFLVELLLQASGKREKKHVHKTGSTDSHTEPGTLPPCHYDAEEVDVERLQEMAESIQERQAREDAAEYNANGDRLYTKQELDATVAAAIKSHDNDGKMEEIDIETTSSEVTDHNLDNPYAKDQKQLMHMGAATALAIAIHNLPEGIVTFVAYTSDPTVGIVLAVGIGIHNIPEGLCVAMPIYYATGNRCKAFLWGILSGVSEPIGALIAWAALKGSDLSGNTYGILFGLVAGIMTLIAADELLPTAHRYDPENKVVTYSFIGGMFAIAASLMLFSV